ncbi:MAG: MATE family efflux transporter [Clostridia bacterium]|nr:MATE family efflux transporter [Clostridia bacterium]
MLHGSLVKKLMLFALPLAATGTVQQLFNAADGIILGHFAGSDALAAVGSTAPIINLSINLFIGLSIGASVVIANYIGQGRSDRISDAVHTAVILSLIAGVTIAVVGICISRPMLHAMGSPDNVIDLSTIYLRIFFAGMPFMMVYIYFSAILRSKGDTKRPLLILLGSGLVKVAVSLLFVVVLGISVKGVALATIIANFLNSSALVYLLLHEDGPFRLRLQKLRITKEHFIRILKIGVPAGVQSMVFSFSNVIIQSTINGFGSDAIAGSAAAVNYEFFCYFVLNAFGQAAVTFTSQNYGAQNSSRCREVFRDCMLLGAAAMFLCNLGFFLGRSFFVLVFTTDVLVIPWAMIRFSHVLIFQWIASSYEISGQCLRGMGHSLLPALISVLGTCVLRIVWIFTIFQSFGTFEMLMNIYPITWAVTGIATLIAYAVISKKEFKKISG